MSEPAKTRRRRTFVQRTPDGRKVFGIKAIAEQIGRAAQTTHEMLASGELDVAYKDGKMWWAFVADLDRWQTERSASSARRG